MMLATSDEEAMLEGAKHGFKEDDAGKEGTEWMPLGKTFKLEEVVPLADGVKEPANNSCWCSK